MANVVSPIPIDKIEMTDAVVASESRTLDQLFDAFTAIERSLSDPNFDPETIVGELTGEIADKVDRIDHVVSAYLNFAAVCKAKAKDLNASATTAANRAKGLLARVRYVMDKHQMTRTMGVTKFFEIAEDAASEYCDTTRKPTAVDHLKYGALVRRYEPTFEWDLNAITRAIKAGQTFDFATLKMKTVLNVADRERLELPADNKKKRSKKS